MIGFQALLYAKDQNVFELSPTLVMVFEILPWCIRQNDSITGITNSQSWETKIKQYADDCSVFVN